MENVSTAPTANAAPERADASRPSASSPDIKRLQQFVSNGYYEDDQGRQDIAGNVLTTEIDFIYDTVVENGFQQCLDIGVAKGVSYASLAAGIKANGGGVLYGVDPDQEADHRKSATRLCSVLDLPCNGVIPDKALYATDRVRSIVQGLDRPELDFVFVDGWHTFDTTMIDFLLADDFLRVGGMIGFHDCYYPSKLKVIRYALRHRDYELLTDVAAPRFSFPLRVARATRNVGGRTWNAASATYWRFNLKTDSSIIVIRKKSDEKPPYYFYKPF